MITNECRLCRGTETVDLPVVHGPDGGIYDYPCPICRPWKFGFPGLFYGRRMVVTPADPGQPAKYVLNLDTPI